MTGALLASLVSSADTTPSIVKNYEVRCDDLSLDQFIDKDGKASNPVKSQTLTTGTEVVTQTGDSTVTQAEEKEQTFDPDRNIYVESTSISITETSREEQLSPYLVRRISKIVNKMTLPPGQSFEDGKQTQEISHNWVDEFSISEDGKRTLTREFVDGAELKLDGNTSTELTEPDGTRHQISMSTSPEDNFVDDGSNWRNLQSESICTMTLKK